GAGCAATSRGGGGGPGPPTPRVVEPPSVCTVSRVAFAPRVHGPFAGDVGHAYVVELRGANGGDTPRAPRHSSIQVCENDRPLGPAHAAHHEIRIAGQGRDSHWGSHLYLSTSDNSVPNTTLRTCRVIGLSPAQR